MEAVAEIGEIHGFLVAVTALFILYSDHKAFGYFRGTHQTLSMRFITWSHRIVWVGLILIILTGVTLVLPAWEYYLSESIFYVKMGFVLTLIMNAFAIGNLSKKAHTTPYAQLTKSEQTTLLVSGGLSVIGWISAIAIGLFLL